ncbi:sigma-70 family RNA polymerase sigma factor [Chitinophaga agrisoli]|uniref:Sigma-70 family RNA polymerase sigma factor n=1 Tax=Chitinophaga agrisoli TaxID=2607653 RepID=A0A5B2VS00_9BACT|nr:sigma-70 family RNA polymerase sigma factor [Chitinophaga agrisoli]KAA2241408.1 sigma-70 family RNA polymerase sigma factor [Chitinophaga agrisoli]
MASAPSSPQQIVDHLFRHESGKMIAVLTRIFGMHNLSLAEDVVQEAFLKAVQSWSFHKIPDNPAAWLMTVARNKALDIIRRQQHFQDLSGELAYHLQHTTESTVRQLFLDTEITDSQLRMIFACCHPSLKEEDQVALTLKTVSGFGPAEIARALVTNEAVIQKRLYRAKQFLKDHTIQLEIPSGQELIPRLETVYTVLYLLFNEGYNSLKTDELIRRDLCMEAMRLCLLLSEHKVGKQPATYALLSLMCLQASRFDSRIDNNNAIVLLQHQDRSAWNKDLINMGYHYLSQSSNGEQITVYHIESAIAAEHCLAPAFADTNWERMLLLYNLLLERKPMPVVWLNRAIVRAQLGETTAAIRDILQLPDIEKLLATHYIYSAVLGDLYLQASDSLHARKYLMQAHTLTPSQAERQLIQDKLRSLDN